MKKIILLIIILLFEIQQVYSQSFISGKVTYVITTKDRQKKSLDSIGKKIKTDLKSNKRSNKTNKWMQKIFKSSSPVKGYLKFSNGEAIYRLEEKIVVDGKKILNITRILSGNDNVFYCNNNTNEYFAQIEIGEVYLVDFYKIEWQITQEKKQIGKYLCYKAIDKNDTNTKQKTFVWFTPQIPVNFGPKKYFGLPGLILEVDQFGIITTATSIVLNPKEKIIIKKPVKGIKKTRKEFNEMGKEFFKKIDKQIKRDERKN